MNQRKNIDQLKVAYDSSGRTTLFHSKDKTMALQKYLETNKSASTLHLKRTLFDPEKPGNVSFGFESSPGNYQYIDKARNEYGIITTELQNHIEVMIKDSNEILYYASAKDLISEGWVID